MNTTVAQRATILALLAIAISATRVHHFAAIPDASWAVFFIGGFYLREWTRWAFPTLMALSVAVDALVIGAQGGSFWQHYCVSPAYWCLVPAYFLMWTGGLWLRRQYRGLGSREAALLAAALPVSVAACHLVAQGSFYWMSSSVTAPTLSGWWQNYSTWLAPYLTIAALYVGSAALAHVLAARLAATAPARAH